MSTAPFCTSKPRSLGRPLDPENVIHEMKASIPDVPHPLDPEALDVALSGDPGENWDTGMHVHPLTPLRLPPPPSQKKGVNKFHAGKEGSLLTHSANGAAERCLSLG